MALFCTRHRRHGQVDEHTLPKLVSIREMRLFFGNDQACSPTWPQPQNPQNRGWSYSNREGIDEKLKYNQKPYKKKVLRKSEKNNVFGIL